MATGALVAGIVGAAASATSAVMGAKAQRQQANAAEAAGEYNNDQAQRMAANTTAEGLEAARRQRVEMRRTLSSISADTAASGAQMEGSPLAVLGEASKRMELNIADETRRAQIQSSQMRQQGAFQLYEGKQNAKSLRGRSVGTLIGGFGNAASSTSTAFTNYFGATSKEK